MNGFSFIFINHFLLHRTPALDYYSITIPGKKRGIKFTSGLEFEPEVWAFSMIFYFSDGKLVLHYSKSPAWG